MARPVPFAFIPIWGAIGIAAGAGFGGTTHATARWVGIGLAFGLALGAIIELVRRTAAARRGGEEAGR